MDRYAHVAQYVYNSVWALMPDKLAVILSLLEFRAAGGRLSDEEIAARIGAVARPGARASGSVAVIPIYGTIAHHAGMMAESSGGVDIGSIAQAFRAAVADSTIGAIALDIDSPGGSVSGVPELALEIYRARGQKPIVAVANTLAASAAYWIGTAADELVVTPSGFVGSVGVVAAHEDRSESLAREGIKVSLVSAGENKTEGSPYGPLTDEARSDLQHRVDEAYCMFVHDVARHRGVSMDIVRSDYGGGRVYGAAEAVKRGMADRVGTIDETVARLMMTQRRQTVASRSARARAILTN